MRRPLFLLTLSLILAAPARADSSPTAKLSPAARARAALALAARPPQSVVRTPQSVVKGVGCPCGCGCTQCQCTWPGECGSESCTCGNAANEPKGIGTCTAGKGKSKAKGKPTAKPDCDCGQSCGCQPGQRSGGCTCGDDCPCSLLGKSALDVGLQRAIAENRPILLWVREVCPPCEKKMPGYVHVHLTQYVGDKDVVEDCCVIVGKPDGQGGVTRVATLPGIPTTEDVARVLTPPKQVVRYAPPPMPVMPMMMPMMGMGGFGGGGFGGGGGGC